MNAQFKFDVREFAAESLEFHGFSIVYFEN